MTDETKVAEEATEQAVETETVDWQAKYEEMRGHARDWEKRAKANQSAADELEQMKAAQMTEQEKANARAEKAEAELAALKSEAERIEAARSISAETGVPLDLLMYCADSEAMTAFAKTYQKEQPEIHAAAKSSGTKVVRGASQTKSAMFADAVRDLL